MTFPISLRRATVAAAVLLTATACSSSGGDDVARDPAPDAPTGPPALELPADVRTRGLVTVMDTGEGPEVCLGAVAESWPPQCGGPEVLGWDWSEHEIHEKQGKVRWGSFVISGSWDGTALTVTDAIPAALYDVMVEEPGPDPLQEWADATYGEHVVAVVPALLPQRG